MAHVQEAAVAARNDRRSPSDHSAEVQEAKRREKMQAHSSSHRMAGPIRHADFEKPAAH